MYGSENDSPYVLLETESGKWSHYAKKANDIVFSPLIPDMENVPDRIVLRRSVADVLEREWQPYLHLLEWMRAVKKMDAEACHALNPRSMTTMLLTGHLPSDYPATRVVYLHEVAHINQLINFPSHWEFSVAVDETKHSPREVRAHLKRMGSVAMKADVYNNYADSLLNVLLGIPSTSPIVRSIESADTQENAEYAGIIRNTILLCLDLESVRSSRSSRMYRASRLAAIVREEDD